MANQIEVVGGKELRRALRLAEDKLLKDELKSANKDAAEVVAKEAKNTVPVRSGRLRSTIKALGSQTKGQVKAGKKAVPYAAAIHWGHRPRKQGGYTRANPFVYDAMDKKAVDVRDAYEARVKELMVEIAKKAK